MYHFIVNPKSCSGKGIKSWWTVKGELDEKSIEYAVHFTEYHKHATKLAQKLEKQNDKIKTIIILGGDGTFNEVLNGINDFSKIILGYIPSGSSNDLARSLGISKDPVIALGNVLKPNYFKYLDCGSFHFLNENKKPKQFACSSGIGFDANVCIEALSSPIKDTLNRFGLGKLTYLTIALKQLFVGKLFNSTVIVDDMETHTYNNVFFITNMIHKYEGGGLAMAPLADPTDGKLDICLVHGLSRLRILSILPFLLFGKHTRFKGVEYFKCHNIEIKTDQNITFHTDGEALSTCSHIKISCLNKHIKMII